MRFNDYIHSCSGNARSNILLGLNEMANMKFYSRLETTNSDCFCRGSTTFTL